MMANKPSDESPNPNDLLSRWIHRLPLGRALDLGAGSGGTAHWLAEQGFQVDAVEMDPARFMILSASCQQDNPRPHHADIAHFQMAAEHYSLILAQAVLHFLRPAQANRVAARIIDALIPGGFLVAEVFTTDDPEYLDLLRLTADPLGAHTFRVSESGDVIHYFEPEELKGLFSSLEILEYDLARRIAPQSRAGYRSGASLVARKHGSD